MANNDQNPKVNFNDGEGLEYTDLNRVSQVLDAAIIEKYTSFSGAAMGNVFEMGQGAGKDNAELITDGNSDGPDTIPDTILLDPFPLTGPFSGLDIGGDLFVQKGALGQVHNANMPGTRPPGSANQVFARLAAEGGTPALNITSLLSTAPVAGDPRWDVYGVRLGYATDNPTARDFKDAITGALSSTIPNKDELIVIAEAYADGSQSVLYDPTTAIAALPAGFVPAMVIRRPAGSGTAVTAADIHYLGFPMRVGVEDTMGYEGHFLGNGNFDVTQAFGPSASATNGFGGAAAWLGSNGQGAIDFYPRTMHAGARLVGIGVSAEGLNDMRIELIRHTYDASGAHSLVTLMDLDSSSSSGRLAPRNKGLEYVSGIGDDPDWAFPGTTLAPTPGYPIWGNGQTYGPCARVTSDVHTRLGLRIQNTSGGGQWNVNDLIHFVRFVYLH